MSDFKVLSLGDDLHEVIHVGGRHSKVRFSQSWRGTFPTRQDAELWAALQDNLMGHRLVVEQTQEERGAGEPREEEYGAVTTGATTTTPRSTDD